MYSIVSIRDTVQGYVSITVSADGENKSYTVRASVYAELGTLTRGAVITEDEMQIILSADEYYRGKRAALSILSYGDNNSRTLFNKLRMRSVSEQTANEIVAEMVTLGYINEGHQLERLITEDANRKLLGPKKFIPRLLSKGYNLSDIREAYEKLSHSGEINIEENKKKLLTKFLGSVREPEQVKKLLYKYGYDF